jgi:hypothetical protein
MEAEPPKAEPPKRERRHFQFRLRTLLIAVTVLCVWLGISRVSHFSMIATDVAKMKVTLDSTPNVIDIPDAQIPFVIEALADARADWNPAKWESVGFIECRMKSGSSVGIDLFYIDGEEMALRTDQTHYFRGADAKRLLAIIKKAGAAHTAH